MDQLSCRNAAQLNVVVCTGCLVRYAQRMGAPLSSNPHTSAPSGWTWTYFRSSQSPNDSFSWPPVKLRSTSTMFDSKSKPALSW